MACPPCFAISAPREVLGPPPTSFSSFICRNSQDLKPEYTGFVEDRSFLLQPAGREQLLLRRAGVSPEVTYTCWCWASKKKRSRGRKRGFAIIWVWAEPRTHFAKPSLSVLEQVGAPGEILIHLISFTDTKFIQTLHGSSGGLGSFCPPEAIGVPKCPSGSDRACKDALLPSSGLLWSPRPHGAFLSPLSQKVSPEHGPCLF